MCMKKLRELVLFVHENGFDHSTLRKGGTGTVTKLQSLYEGILNDEWQMDEDAARALYPDEPSSVPYRKLKSDLRDRMLEAVLALRFEGGKYNGYQKAYFRCHKEWAAVKLLMSHGNGDVAADLAAKLLKQAYQYEFTLIAQDICGILRLYYGARLGNMAKFEEYNAQYNELRDIHQWESLAEEYYIQLSSAFVNAKATREELPELSKQFLTALKPGLERYKTYRLYFYGALIELASHTSVHAYAEALDVCKRYISFFEEKNYETQVPLQVLYYQELLCHIQLKHYEEGQNCADKCGQLVKEGSFNWFKYQESLFLLSMHTGEYQAAYKVYFSVTKNKYFAHLPDSAQEIWTIFAAYLAFLAQIGKLGAVQNERIKTLKASRFQNETPLYSKDKKGMNIPILIAQLLLLLAEGKKSAYLDKLESLEQYNYKYLRNKHNMRNHYFMKILLKIPLCGFKKENFLDKTRELFSGLASTPSDSVFQNSTYEIIPYEVLYSLISEQLV